MRNNILLINNKYFGMGLNRIDIAILSHIEERERDRCKCYTTNEKLSEMFGESVEDIELAINRLEDMNLIKIDTRFKRALSLNHKYI